jgi:hypothetical protein
MFEVVEVRVRGSSWAGWKLKRESVGEVARKKKFVGERNGGGWGRKKKKREEGTVSSDKE